MAAEEILLATWVGMGFTFFFCIPFILAIGYYIWTSCKYQKEAKLEFPWFSFVTHVCIAGSTMFTAFFPNFASLTIAIVLYGFKLPLAFWCLQEVKLTHRVVTDMTALVTSSRKAAPMVWFEAQGVRSYVPIGSFCDFSGPLKLSSSRCVVVFDTRVRFGDESKIVMKELAANNPGALGVSSQMRSHAVIFESDKEAAGRLKVWSALSVILQMDFLFICVMASKFPVVRYQMLKQVTVKGGLGQTSAKLPTSLKDIPKPPMSQTNKNPLFEMAPGQTRTAQKKHTVQLTQQHAVNGLIL